MAYYTGTQADCQAYLEQVNAGENYQGTTTTWAEIRQHPTDVDLFAIVKHSKYASESLTEVEALDESWTPSEDIPEAEIVE